MHTTPTNRAISDRPAWRLSPSGRPASLGFTAVAATAAFLAAAGVGRVAGRFMVYLIVGSLVTICLWTRSGVRDTVDGPTLRRTPARTLGRGRKLAQQARDMFSDGTIYGTVSALSLTVAVAGLARHTAQFAELSLFFAAVLLSLCAASLWNRRESAPAVVLLADDREIKVDLT